MTDTHPGDGRQRDPGGSGEPAPGAGESAGEDRGAPPRPVRLTAWVRGRVQGVGFRWWTRATALEIGSLTGYVSNLEDGRVQVVAEGSRERCERLLDWLRTGATPGRVTGVTEIWGTARGGYDDFRTR